MADRHSLDLQAAYQDNTRIDKVVISVCAYTPHPNPDGLILIVPFRRGTTMNGKRHGRKASSHDWRITARLKPKIRETQVLHAAAQIRVEECVNSRSSPPIAALEPPLALRAAPVAAVRHEVAGPYADLTWRGAGRQTVVPRARVAAH